MKSWVRQKELKEILAGAFVLVIFVFIFSLVYNKKQLKPEETNFKLYALFNKVDGIREGSVVQLSGIPVGYVTAMELDPFYRIVLTLSFKKPVDLPMDTAAIIETNGLIGNKYIELVPGGDEENIKEGSKIAYTQDVLLIDDLLNRLLEFMRKRKGEASQQLSEGVEK